MSLAIDVDSLPRGIERRDHLRNAQAITRNAHAQMSRACVCACVSVYVCVCARVADVALVARGRVVGRVNWLPLALVR